MTDSDKPKFFALLRFAASVTALPNGKTVDGVAFALFEGLRQYDLECVDNAVKRHVRMNRFFPMLADIVGLIEGDNTEKALGAWRIVVRAIENIGHWHSVRFPPPIAAAIEFMGGWVWLSTHFTYSNAPFLQKEFERHFSVALRHPSSVAVADFLPGIDDTQRDDRRRPLEIIDAVTGDAVVRPALAASPSPSSPSVVLRLASKMRA